MKQPKKKIIIASVILLATIAFFTFWSSKKIDIQETALCEEAYFETTVTATGELQAIKSLDINIPYALTNLTSDVRIYYIKINDLAPEGTMLKQGDYVASLNPTDVENELSRISEQVKQETTAREEAKLDSSLRLSNLRTDIRNASDGLKERQIKVEQSSFESKAYQRQAVIELETAKRNLDRIKRNYSQHKRKHELTLERKNNDLQKIKDKQKNLLELKAGLKIVAPADGMLLYGKNWRGNKIKIGDDVGRFSPLIATLPDLTSLVSEAFVQEVDIKQIKKGQKVKMTIDAFPNIEFTGSVINIANIGQKMPDKQMNGFKTIISIDASSKKILPGMTSSNNISIASYTNALIIPRPAVFKKDSISYVYVKKQLSTVKQQVITDGENETHFRIVKGLSKNDEVYLFEPKEAINMEISRL